MNGIEPERYTIIFSFADCIPDKYTRRSHHNSRDHNSCTFQSEMSASPLHSHTTVLGMACHDTVVTVERYPQCDTKNVTQTKEIFGGGNGGTVAIALSRLGCPCYFVSSMFKDSEGLALMREFDQENVSLKFADIRGEGRTGTSYIIVDNETKGRTIFHSRQAPDELRLASCGGPSGVSGRGEISSYESLLRETKILFTDGRFPETTHDIIKAAYDYSYNNGKMIPVIMDCERLRGPKTAEMVKYCNVISCAETFIDILYEYRKNHGDANRGQQDDEIRRANAEAFAKVQIDDKLRDEVRASVGINNTLRDGLYSLDEEDFSSEQGKKPFPADEILPKLVHKKRQLQTLLNDYANLDCAIITFGSDGNLCMVREGMHAFWTPAWKPSNKDVLDTCGAGDCFNGGLAFGYGNLKDGAWNVEEVVAFATLVAGLAVTEMGSRPGLPRFSGDFAKRGDFKEFVRRVVRENA